jgi:carboxyl-terminal processing protease
MKPTFKKVLYAIIWIVIGIFIGSEIMLYLWKKQNVQIEYALRTIGKGNKVSALLNAIDKNYVDSVNVDSLVNNVLPMVLSELDPHSAYYPAEETQESNNELHGSFSGIGVQFSIQEDTIRVNSVINGGPSKKVGVLAGDRIIKINDSLFTGKHIKSEDVVKNLKGPSGTDVKISVLRNGDKNLIDFTIERGEIPVKSVDAAYMMNKEIGYIVINKFGETTYSEMMTGLAKLSKEGMKKLIVDLRGNTGGYLGAVIQMVNEFLPKGEMIVYTQGVHSPYSAQYANGRGRYMQLPLVILIDESTASASEIFTGAIQDNDRGIVVGRRSFGKGLVQEPIEFTDGSSIRLTIARYYTPSGRCIQKPYGSSDEDYAMDIVKRYEHGEFFSADSVKLNENEIFKTKGGRTVYGGGGIMPDFFVPQDTIAYSEYYASIVRKSLVNKYAFRYVDSRRNEFSKFEKADEIVSYLDKQNAFNNFINYASDNGVKRDSKTSSEAIKQLRILLYANIVYNALDMQEYIRFINRDDNTVKKAIESFSNSPI